MERPQPVPAAAVKIQGSCLSFSEKLTYSFGQIAVSLSPALVSSWLIYYYIGRQNADGTQILLVSAAAMSLAGLIPRCIEALAEPAVGYLSDKIRFRMGRRIPWIVFGTPFLALFSILIWFPPDLTGRGTAWFTFMGLDIGANFAYLVATHSAFWIAYTAVIAPYLSLLPEITPYNDERIQTSMYMAYSDVIGTLLGTIGLGVMLGIFVSGATMGPIVLDNAYKVSSFVIAAIFVAALYTSVFMIRERPAGEVAEMGMGFGAAFVETFRNPSFPPYVVNAAAIRMSLDIVLACMPFMAGAYWAFRYYGIEK